MVAACIFLFGLAFGSFVNALVWRVHEQATSSAKRANKELSITKGRSMCPHCKHRLHAKDLIPIFSWLWLKGKCRYCHKSISWQYPLVELVTAGLFVLSYLVWPHSFDLLGSLQLAVWLLCITIFMALVVYDMRWMILPDRVVLPLTILAAVQIGLLTAQQGSVNVLIGGLLGVLCLAGLFYVLFQVSDGKWIGGGDVKLGVSLGLLVGGPAKALAVLFLAACLGTICTLPLLVLGKKKASQQLPFGPFLIAATIIIYLFGTGLVAWYKKQFLLL